MMSVGLSIFLSALIFAVILLYWITRDRWNWARGGRRFVFGTAILLAIGGIGLGIWWGFRQIANYPQKQTKYADLALGMTMAEVEYVKGPPPLVYNPSPEDQFLETQIGPQGSINGDKYERYTEAKYYAWVYPLDAQPGRIGPGSQIEVSFDPKSKTVTKIWCSFNDLFAPNTSALCPSLLGIRVGTREEELSALLPSQSDQRLFETSDKLILFKSLGTGFWLQQKKVFSLGIMLPKCFEPPIGRCFVHG